MKKRNLTGLAMSAVLGAGLLLAPATAATAHDGPHGCEVTGGTLTWGVIERWRAYVSGTIANGVYEPVDGAEYEIPNFVWKNASGEIDPETGAGHVSFTGGAHFTGHNGQLDTTFANPTIAFAEDGTAKLLLDVKSLGRDGGDDTDEQQVELGDLGSVAAIDAPSGGYALDAAPVTLTQLGSDVFTAYEPGLPMDPIVLSVEFDCAVAEAEQPVVEEAPPAQEDESETAPEPVEQESSSVPWLSIGIGAIVAVAVAAAGIVFARRKKSAGEDPSQNV